MAKLNVPRIIKDFNLISNDEYVTDQLQSVCHACAEKQRFTEDNLETSEFRSMFFNGQFSESTGGFIDFLSITH